MSNTNTNYGENSLINIIDGNNNTAVGYNSLYSLSNGVSNTAIGTNSLFELSEGVNNTAIGYNSGNIGNSFNNTTCLGANTYATGHNQVIIGDVNTSSYVQRLYVNELSSSVIDFSNNNIPGVVSSVSGLLVNKLIYNNDIASGASIDDSKLATISSSGKIANQATSATTANTSNTIVLRDGSGNINALDQPFLTSNQTVATTFFVNHTITQMSSVDKTENKLVLRDENCVIYSDFIGNLIGNVLGNVIGNVVGNVTGNIFGNITGKLTGTVIGNVTGNLFGYATNALNANTAILQPYGTNNNTIANTAFVQTAINNIDLSGLSLSEFKNLENFADNLDTIKNNATPGLLHNDICGNVFSSMIVNNDISNNQITLNKISSSTATINALPYTLVVRNSNSIVQSNINGNITGELIGNVIGNLTGNVNGELIGNVIGNLTGNVNGDLTGNVIGNVNGNVTGTITATGNFNLIPAGTIQTYLGNTAPNGFFMCDGTAVSRTTYADLFAVIGTTYGVGDGSTTFNLPDFRGYFLKGN